MWKGAIQFGLVTIPVKMYLATESKGVSFNMLHTACRGRIQMKTYCPTDDEIIERSDTVRGYEVAPDRYVVITDEDLASVPLKTVRAIEIEQFVPVDSSGWLRQAGLLPGAGAGRPQGVLPAQTGPGQTASSGRLQDRPARSRAARRPRPVRQHDHALDALLARRGPLGGRPGDSRG
jgi:DNA end-binding protein Ku